MKKLSGLPALIAAFSLLTAQSAGAAQTDSVRELRERGEGLSRAFGSHDLNGIRSAVADSILMGTGKGRHKRVSREEYIRGISRMFSAAHDFQLARSIEQISVRGPVASVLVSQAMAGTDVNGETHRIGDRLLQTWKKTSGGWFLVSESEIPASRGTGLAWYPLSSRQGGFTVSMPGRPLEIRKTVNYPFGPVELRGYGAQPGRGPESFLVTYLDMPEAIVKGKSTASLLAGAENGVRGNGRLVSSRPVSLQGHQGRELQLRVDRGLRTVRVFLVNQRLYEVLCTAPDEAQSSQDRAHFLDSFRLVIPQ